MTLSLPLTISGPEMAGKRGKDDNSMASALRVRTAFVDIDSPFS